MEGREGGGGGDGREGQRLGCVLEVELMRFTAGLDGRRRNILCLNLKGTLVDLMEINRTNINLHLQLSLTE